MDFKTKKRAPKQMRAPFYRRRKNIKTETTDRSTMNKWLVRSIALAGGMALVRSIYRSSIKYNVKNKVILITGGSRGLGLIMARQLVGRGAKVVICARDEQELIDATEQLSAKTQNFLAVPCDITDKEQVKRMIREIEGIMGPIDVLINNAGIMQVGPVETMTEKDFEEAMKVHFWGPFYLMDAVIPMMKKRKKGRIVNIVSIGGKVSFPHLLPYNASKFALSGFSEGLTAELSKDNIKVTTVYPGLMRTGSARNADVKGQHENEYAWFKIADSLPFISKNAEKASKQIVKAMQYGEKTLTLTFPAKIAAAMHTVAPDFTISALDFINRALPGTKGVSEKTKKRKKGYQSESTASSSYLTKRTKEAESRSNEL